MLRSHGVQRAKLYRGHLNEVEFFQAGESLNAFGERETEPPPGDGLDEMNGYDRAALELATGILRKPNKGDS